MADRTKLPDAGIDHDELLETMRGFRGGDADWKGARTWSLVYYPGDEHYALLKEAYSLFFSANGLNPMAFKSLKRMEAEVVRMTASMLNGGPDVVGTMTSGGTESILMAVKAARDRASFLKKIPFGGEVVAPRTIHPAFSKAAHYFGLKMRYAPVDANFQAIPAEIERRIGRRTVLVAASAPQYPHGMVDPIPAIGAIAQDRGVPFHVDACFGGFLLPFVEKLGYELPTFDFRVPGVTSMSADVHKYGYAAKGASTVLYRDMSYLKHQFFVETEFPGGIYISPTMAGTRPGGAIAAAWASLMGLGEEGLTRLTEGAMQTAAELKRQLRGIAELEILGSEHASIVCFRARDEHLSTYAIADELQERGWSLDRQQKPASLHLTVTAHHASVVDEFVADLRQAVETVARHPELGQERQAAMYGMMAKVPFRGMVKLSVQKVMEELYGPNAADPDLETLGKDEDAGAIVRLVDRFGPKVLDSLERVEAVGQTLRAKLPF